MKRAIQLAILTAATMPLIIAGAAAADTANNCNIYQTGTDSYNACVASNNNQTYVTCVHNVYTVYTTTQNANSGNTNANSNTSTGNNTSGSAVNANGTTVTIGASCNTPTPTPTPPATTVSTTTPTTPTPKTTTTVATTKPAASVLPETGSNILTESAIIGLTAVAGVLALSKIGQSLVQRINLK